MTKALGSTLLWCAIASTNVVCCGGEVGTDPPAARREASVQEALLAAFDTEGSVSVIVNLREPAPSRAHPDFPGALREMRDEVTALHVAGFTVTRTFARVPAIAGRVTRDALERLRHDPNVSYLQLDSRGGGHLKEAVPAIGADQVKSLYGLTGLGVRVAVLDTGVVTTHPDLSDSIVAQHCFTQFDCTPAFASSGTSAEDDNGHGSNVTGIITSNGVVSSPGFAPAAEIVAVKVNDASDAGQSSDWVSGLDWVYENLSTLKVKIVNLSLGTDALYTTAADCDRNEPALARAVKNLVDAGVTVFASSGNQGSKTQLAAPACNTGVIAVGATYDSSAGYQPSVARTYQARWGQSFADCSDPTTAFDQITCFTNSSARLDLVAPGAPILSDSLGGKTEMYWGTSQAAPAAAGVAALLLQCKPAMSPSEVEQAMVATGVRRTDPKNGLSIPSLRALDLIRSVCFGADAGAGVPSGGGANAGGSAGSGGSGERLGAGGNGGSASGGATGGSAGGASTANGGAAGRTGVGGGGAASGGNAMLLPSVGNSGGAADSFVTGSRGTDAGCTCSTLSRRSSPPRSLALYGLFLVALQRWRPGRREPRCRGR